MYIVSVAPIVTALMVIAALLYVITHGWGTLIALVCALVVLWGRWVLQRQASKDFADMRMSVQGFKATGKDKYLEFIKLRGEQMLRDNKALTSSAKAEIGRLLDYVERKRGA
ncbi:hypothetical protein HF984_07505 [Rothia terrae]|uniref:Uncharacterized protein n=1 Tax=Rothia terrae TaxID=396015 RepID=A0A7H2BGH2_9MICC|nr:hypothetical protein [Rothia terrae]QNV38768.1 hypothetical protein IDM49_00355 [Rothia terrae]